MPMRSESHQAPCARLQHLLGRAPADQVGGARERGSRRGAAEAGRRPVEEDPLPVDAVGQERGVLVVRVDRRSRGARPIAKSSVVARIDGRTGRPVGGAGDHPAVELLDPDGARVLEAPLLALDARRRREQRLRVDRQPSIPFAERATERCEIPRQILDPASRTVSPSTTRRSRVEDGVDGIGPVLAVRTGLAGCRRKSSRSRAAGTPLRRHAAVPRACAADAAGKPAASSSSAARWNASVDSAPSIVVGRLLAQPVAAAAGGEVVQRPTEAVAAEEPVECPLRAQRRAPDRR